MIETLKLYLVKVFIRLRILMYFNFFLKKKINGVKIKIPFINGIGISNFISSSDWINPVIRTFQEGTETTFIDVGANIGQTLIKVKTIFPDLRYIGFEPNSVCKFYTDRLIEKNRFKNCLLLNYALYNEMRLNKLSKNSPDDLTASVLPSLRPGFFSNEDFILTAIYDTLFPEEKIGIVKIDVEGSELEVLKGMIKSVERHKPVILCEVLDSFSSSVYVDSQNRATELSSMIKNMGYSIIQLKIDAKTDKIKSFEKIRVIVLKQWTVESQYLNDYMFYPEFKEEKVFEKLTKICFDHAKIVG